MNIVDVLILLALGLGAVIGFKRGFFKQTVTFVGTILVVVFAFILKGPVAALLYEYFPFFNFEGLSSLNILLYEGIAFIIVLALLSLLLRILIALTGILEKILNFTIILGIPSKILGAIVGLFEAYIVVYIVLLVISSPIINISIINESKYKDTILNKTPILSNVTKGLVSSFDEIIQVKNDDTSNNSELDKKIFDIIVKNGIAAKDKLNELVEEGKINVNK